jgi:hypothetical protein
VSHAYVYPFIPVCFPPPLTIDHFRPRASPPWTSQPRSPRAAAVYLRHAYVGRYVPVKSASPAASISSSPASTRVCARSADARVHLQQHQARRRPSFLVLLDHLPVHVYPLLVSYRRLPFVRLCFLVLTPLIHILCSFLTSRGACSSSSKFCAASLQLLLQASWPRCSPSRVSVCMQLYNTVRFQFRQVKEFTFTAIRASANCFQFKSKPISNPTGSFLVWQHQVMCSNPI